MASMIVKHYIVYARCPSTSASWMRKCTLVTRACAIFGTAVRPHTEIYIFDLFWQVVDHFARSAEVESPEVEMTPEIEPRSSMNFDEI